MHILALEAYDGGSHKQFLDGLIRHSRHRFLRLGLPARKWKWRMRGAAIYFAQQLDAMLDQNKLDGENIDVIFFSSMLAGADLRALLPKTLRDKPMVCYFHENQLTYPLEDESQRDYQYGFTQITTCLAADALWFNSQYHLDSFVEGVERLLKQMPDFVPKHIEQTIQKKATVLPLGLNEDVFLASSARRLCHSGAGRNPELPGDKATIGSMDPGLRRGDRVPQKEYLPPTVLWNHRWEYDKNPDDFFEMLFDLDRAGLDFRLIVAGENFRTAPPIFSAAQKRLENKITHFGYVRDRRSYVELLLQADMVVSTAHHEFYGLAVLEAIAAGCTPLLPNRLSYPELLPCETHALCLYNTMDECRDRLSQWFRNSATPLPEILLRRVADLAWPKLIERFEEGFAQLMDYSQTKRVSK